MSALLKRKILQYSPLQTQHKARRLKMSDLSPKFFLPFSHVTRSSNSRKKRTHSAHTQHMTMQGDSGSADIRARIYRARGKKLKEGSEHQKGGGMRCDDGSTNGGPPADFGKKKRRSRAFSSNTAKRYRPDKGQEMASDIVQQGCKGQFQWVMADVIHTHRHT